MCNRCRVPAKQLDLPKQYGLDVGKLMPEPERMPPPELFPKKPGWIVLSLDVMPWGIPRHMKGKSGKLVVSYVNNVRNPKALLALDLGEPVLPGYRRSTLVQVSRVPADLNGTEPICR